MSFEEKMLDGTDVAESTCSLSVHMWADRAALHLSYILVCNGSEHVTMELEVCRTSPSHHHPAPCMFGGWIWEAVSHDCLKVYGSK